MIWLNILWPTFAMVALTFAVLVTLAVRRVGHVRVTPPTRETFSSAASEAAYFTPLDRHGRNLANLFELPVLFYALVALLVVTRQAWPAQVLLAWMFVALRAGHSWVHIRRTDVRTRFRLFLLSVVVLAVMWVGFFADTVAAAVAYRDAMAGLVAKP